MTISKIIPVCGHCASKDVYFDAYAVWDVDKQDYELVTAFDNVTCKACGKDSKYADWIELDTGNESA